MAFGMPVRIVLPWIDVTNMPFITMESVFGHFQYVVRVSVIIKLSCPCSSVPLNRKTLLCFEIESNFSTGTKFSRKEVPLICLKGLIAEELNDQFAEKQEK